MPSDRPRICGPAVLAAGRAGRRPAAASGPPRFAWLLLSFLAATAAAQEAPTASLPLAEVLRLYRENEASRQQVAAKPPFPATVNKVELSGRLLEEAIELDARFEVTVLDAGAWVSVPLLKRGAGTALTALPAIADAVLAVDGEQLSLVTRHPGVYSFEVALVERARRDGRRRTAVIDYGVATLARLFLRLDPGLFRLEGPAATDQGEGLRIDPEDGRFTVVWERIAELPGPRPAAAARPPIESVVTTAHASAVSTLEGKVILRLLYHLRFEGSRGITFVLPAGCSLERLYLNGVAAPFAVDGTTLPLDVEPRRAGDPSATAELVLERDHGGYNLSGDLFFELPGVSWPVNELTFDAHLPQVFNYTWTGGSLAPVDASPDPVFAYAIPRPGKRLSFHQYLISKTSPTLRLGYAIDLTEKYFRGAP